MLDELLPYYNRELSFVRRMAADFARENPKIAARLLLGEETSEDPHVERLIESFAFLNARLRHKLEDDFPEITESFLGVLYPHYLRPIPSATIVRFGLGEDQADLLDGSRVPRGALLRTDSIAGEPCYYRTCYDLNVVPLDLVSAELSPRPLPAPETPRSSVAKSVLKIQLSTFDEKTPVRDLNFDSLRFFLRGLPHHVYPLYELFLNHVVDVAIAADSEDPKPVLIDRECVRPVGFEKDEALYPWPEQSSHSYRLLCEYFAFPQKFSFIEITDIPRSALDPALSQLELYVYFDVSLRELEQNVSEEMLQLGCSPVVNLFNRRADPIVMNQLEESYRVVPDSRYSDSHEIYSIDRVDASFSNEQDREVRPLFGITHGTGEDAWYWQSTRRASVPSLGQPDKGTEVYLSVTDLTGAESGQQGWILDIETTCLNRDLPGRLPFGGGQPRLSFAEGGGTITELTCLVPPTPTLRPNLGEGNLWRLISHLTLSHLSIVGGERGAESLQEIMKMYDYRDSSETQDLIASLISVSSERVVGRIPGERMGAGYGLEVKLLFRKVSFSEKGVLVLALVLEHFLAEHCTINSFVRVVVEVEGREHPVRSGPPRAGRRILV
ncbi:MAG TPA: type VI secretion system baseplate subunit TssF [Planctomycetaceae bacterium]|nr:type VI secretion system baseplate subunit TssF [Planctomycetaceae bacterium]